MRQRHKAHPRLESIERRLVPSGAGVHHQALADRAAAAHAELLLPAELRTGARHAAMLIRIRGEHQHLAHSLARPHNSSTSSHTSTGSLSADINNFFKSVFRGL
jgi:hypothetical protein